MCCLHVLYLDSKSTWQETTQLRKLDHQVKHYGTWKAQTWETLTPKILIEFFTPVWCQPNPVKSNQDAFILLYCVGWSEAYTCLYNSLPGAHSINLCSCADHIAVWPFSITFLQVYWLICGYRWKLLGNNGHCSRASWVSQGNIVSR